MLVNVRYYRSILKVFIFLIFFSINLNLKANEKEKITSQLINLKTLEFSFNQMTNNKIEDGSCLLEFPGKLRCEYFDDNQKELVINKKKLAITQKRYDKTYHYPLSKSPFLNILYKEKLLEIVKSGRIKISDKIVELEYSNGDQINILFDKENLNLKGWKIVDQYNNVINFNLKILSKNQIYKKETFKIPDIN